MTSLKFRPPTLAQKLAVGEMVQAIRESNESDAFKRMAVILQHVWQLYDQPITSQLVYDERRKELLGAIKKAHSHVRGQ